MLSRPFYNKENIVIYIGGPRGPWPLGPRPRHVSPTPLEYSSNI